MLKIIIHMSPKMSYLHSKNNVFCSMNLNQFSALPSPLYPCGFFPKFYGNVGVISLFLFVTELLVIW